MAIQHPPLTGLDHDSMARAYNASFRALYGRESSGHAGGGADDREYWIGSYDHFGEYSDGVERAGWNRYAEVRLGGASSADPKLGDEPAHFLPDGPPLPMPPGPLPAPPTTLVPDSLVGMFLKRLDQIDAAIGALRGELASMRLVQDKGLVVPYLGTALPPK